MTSQKRTIMGACEYAILALQDVKKGMMDLGSPDHQVHWAIGSLIVTLSANLIKICQEVIDESAQAKEPNARTDLQAIQYRFNQFFDGMLGHE